jgi:hypothetical protein
MTARTAFDDEQWKVISEGPVTAGMIVLTASGGGSFRESFALARAYADARGHQGASELLDEIVKEKPQFDRHRFKQPEALHDEGLELLGQAAGLVREKAADDLDAYREFVVTLASAVAAAHKEEGQAVSPKEQAALDEIRGRLADPPG